MAHAIAFQSRQLRGHSRELFIGEGDLLIGVGEPLVGPGGQDIIRRACRTWRGVHGSPFPLQRSPKEGSRIATVLPRLQQQGQFWPKHDWTMENVRLLGTSRRKRAERDTPATAKPARPMGTGLRRRLS